MKNIKTYETWKDNRIDHSLFKSGKAKYDPQVSNGSIKYKTGNKLPYYHAEIKEKGDKFICKIYKKNKDGDDIRLRNKVKDDLRLAHNYVREFLNQKLKRDEEKKDNPKKKKDSIEKSVKKEVDYSEYTPKIEDIKPRRKTRIRRF
jgi:hypothetical protein